MSWLKLPALTECRKSCAPIWRRQYEPEKHSPLSTFLLFFFSSLSAQRCISPYCDRFILKGASLFLVWKGQNYRVTRDADFLGFGNPDTEQLADLFRDICNVELRDDGMIYLSDTLKIAEIREDQEYDGVRITLVGLLNQARISLQIDIGFGDAITPAPENIEYPVLLDYPPPLLKAYPRYTLVAFTPVFYNDLQKQIQWHAFIKKSKPDIPVGDLGGVIAEISLFIMPVIESQQSNAPFECVWLPDQGWRIGEGMGR